MKRRAQKNSKEAGALGRFASELQALRQASGLTAAQTHRSTGVPLSTIYAALSGSRLPSPELLDALVTAWDGDKSKWQGLRSEVEVQLATGTASDSDKELPVATFRRPGHQASDTDAAAAQGGETIAMRVAAVSSRLDNLREAAGGPSLRELAFRAGLSPSTLSRAMSGRRLPPWRVIEKVTKALDVPQNDAVSLRRMWQEAARSPRLQQPSSLHIAEPPPSHGDVALDQSHSLPVEGSHSAKLPGDPSLSAPKAGAISWEAAWTLGNQLRKLRVERHKSLSDAAKAIGHSVAHLSRIERAETIPNTQDIRGLARFYKITDQEFRALESQLILRMTHSQAPAIPVAQRMILGIQLRGRRQASSMSVTDAARLVGMSGSKLSRLEAGMHDFKRQDLARLFDLYKVSPAEQQYLLDLLENATERPWWQDWSDVATTQLQSFVSLEETAQRIRTYQSTQLPSLLQTEEYARAVIEVGIPESTPRTVERLVELHQNRIQRFEGSAPNRLICVIDEATLIRPFGGIEVMRRQLDHLIAMTEDSRHSMRIAELTKPNLPVNLGMTTIFDFEGRTLPTIVYTEHFDGAFILQKEEEVDRRVKAFDRLQSFSLSRDQSSQRLRDLRMALS